MDVRGLIGSDQTAWAVGTVALLIAVIAAFVYLGWLGIGLVGLVGLLITTRLSLHGGHAIADSDHGSGAVGIYARQIEKGKRHAGREAGLAAAADKAKGKRALHLLNTALIALTALGFGLFLLHQV